MAAGINFDQHKSSKKKKNLILKYNRLMWINRFMYITNAGGKYRPVNKMWRG